MSDLRELLDREARLVDAAPQALESVFRRRDRKRRNQRIAAGAVGIAVFVAAVLIVTSGLSFDRSETPAVPGPAETGPTEAGPAQTEPAAPDVVSRGTCSGGHDARAHLVLTDVGSQIEVRFVLHSSLSTDRVPWGITLRHRRPNTTPDHGVVFFEGTRRTGGDSSDLEVVRRVPDWSGPDALSAKAKAIDPFVAELCRAYAELR